MCRLAGNFEASTPEPVEALSKHSKTLFHHALDIVPPLAANIASFFGYPDFPVDFDTL